MSGNVVEISPDGRHGRIYSPGDDRAVFFYAQDVAGFHELDLGSLVSYTLLKTPRGPRALYVQVLQP
jgi:cold shock CspA family protein